MLALERRPKRPRPGKMFLRARADALRGTVAVYRGLFPRVEPAVRQLASFTVAMADGLFVSRKIDGDAVDVLGHFETLGIGVFAVADHLAAGRDHRLRQGDSR